MEEKCLDTYSNDCNDEEGNLSDENVFTKDKKNYQIQIDMSVIPSIPQNEQNSELRELGVISFEQECYEKGVRDQVDQALKDHSLKVSERNVNRHKISSILSFPNNDSKGKTSQNTIDMDVSDSSEQNNFDCVKRKKFYLHDEFKEKEEFFTSDEENDKVSDEDYIVEEEEKEEDIEEYFEEENEEEYEDVIKFKRKRKQSNKSKSMKTKSIINKTKKIIDDGDDEYFNKRIKEARHNKLVEKHKNILENIPFEEYITVEGDFKVPTNIWDNLYSYQQTAVRWLWELHQLSCGGIIGDEMGLGKTVQLIAFLAGLSVSTIYNFREERSSLGPVILVCPATVMHQWVAEFHKWWPYIRVAVLHNTGSFKGNKATLVKNMNKSNGVIITSYSSIVLYQNLLYKYNWHYLILDEGHKIRNPDAKATIACKKFSTPHRLILSGSPIQNNLKELWSLFDFVYPGKLGTLPVFMEKFAVPITQGGYANASKVQIEIAFKCATVLRDAIKPYLLRRIKSDVLSSLNLPSKNEQVLFCRMTEEQKEAYIKYLNSNPVKDILTKGLGIFVGLINLGKICNHPDLLIKKEGEWGYYKKSGKMKVVEVLLRLWGEQGHRVLIFTQTRQMLKIIEKFLNYREYKYLKMDGRTPVSQRQQLVKEFNNNNLLFIFLLTTKVGGIGLNLIGANRVIIYDPDWNPVTDIQAKERVYRIGQKNDVTIYRLLCMGTIEEKIYTRQVFKSYLAQRVLKGGGKRLFETGGVKDLFTWTGDDKDQRSNSKIKKKERILSKKFTKIKMENDKINKSDQKKESQNMTNDQEINKILLPPEKILELREKAKSISKMISQKFSSLNENSSEKNSKDFKSKNLNEDLEINTSKSKNVISQFSSSQEKDNNQNKLVKKEKKHKTKGVLFEGKRIKYLVKCDSYKDIGKNKESSKKQDDYVMKKLLKNRSMHSAIRGGIEDKNEEWIEMEAEKVATDAIKALKKSRQQCFDASSGIPNWTGSKADLKFGKSAKEINQKKINYLSQDEKYENSEEKESPGKGSTMKSYFSSKAKDWREEGISSLQIMKAMKERNNLIQDIGNDDVQQNELLTDLRTFIGFQANIDGEATTQELLEFFKNKSVDKTPIFKSLLWQLCDFTRKSDGTGVWRLKDEFR